MLFGPFEKQLDLPSCFVQRRYRRGGEFEVIGHKHVVSGTEPIAVAHASELDRTAFGGEYAGKHNRLIAGDTGTGSLIHAVGLVLLSGCPHI